MVKSLLVSGLFAATALAASRMTAPAGAIVVAKSGGDYDTVSMLESQIKHLQTCSNETSLDSLAPPLMP